MTTETIETAPAPADPEPQTVQTETPATEVVAESAAVEPEAAAVPQVEVTEPEKPNYITREEWERERAEVAAKAAADALEQDRRRRQTENARRAKAEAEQREADQEAIDTLKAALGAKGVYEVPDEAAISAINRITAKKAERLASNSLDVMEQAWDFLTAPAYGKEVDLDESAEAAARRLGPKVQHLVNTIRPAIEAEARKGYIPESEIPARVEAEITRRNAQKREGTTELRRPEGEPPSNKDMSPHAIVNRIISGDADDADRTAYPDAQRRLLQEGR